MAIAYRSNTSAEMSGTASPTVNAPSGLQDGDLIILLFTSSSAHTIDTVLTGWTQLGSTQTGAGDDLATSILYKFASSEGASWTFTDLFATTESGIVGGVAYSGVDSTTPFDVAVVQGNNGYGADHSAGPITPTSANAMLVAMFSIDPGGVVTGTPGSSPACTERLDVQGISDALAYIEEYQQVTAAEVTLDVTLSASDIGTFFVMALRTAAAGGGVAPTSTLSGPLGGPLAGVF